MRKFCNILIISILFLYGCRPDVGWIEVSGTLGVAARSEVSLCLLRDAEPMILDEGRVGVNGNFNLGGSIEACELAELRFGNGLSPITLVLNPGERIEVSMEMGEYHIQGSRETLELHRIERKLAACQIALAAIHAQYADTLETAQRRALQHNADSIAAIAQSVAMNYIERNPYTLTAMLLLRANMSADRQLIDYVEHRAVYQKVSRALTSVFPDRADVADFGQMVRRLELRHSAVLSGVKPQVGNRLPLLRIPMPDSTELQIPGLKGRLVLLSVEPCWTRSDVLTDYTSLFERFAHRGLALVQVVSVVDGGSMPADTVRWLRTTIGNPAEYAFVAQLGIERLPCNFVIDSRGQLLATNIDETELEQLFAKHLGQVVALPAPRPAAVDTLRAAQPLHELPSQEPKPLVASDEI